jgi:antitoxin VapB
VVFVKTQRQNMTNRTAKVFQNGKSQAVRLPKEFRFEGNEVGIRWQGDEVVLSPKQDQMKRFLDSLAMFDDDAVIERNQPKTADERIALKP